MPSDRTGENPLWVSEEPFWDDFYTLCKLPLAFNPDPHAYFKRGYISLYGQPLSCLTALVLRVHDPWPY